MNDRDEIPSAVSETTQPPRLQELSLEAFSFLTALRDEQGAVVDFRWDYVNPAAARLLHTTPDRLIGRRMRSVLPDSEHGREVFRRCVEVVETGVSHDIEVEYQSEEGVRGWFRNAAVKLGNSIAIYFSDITERKRAEEALHESETRFRGTFENATVGLSHVDLTGRWVRVNQKLCEILGYSREELLAMSFTQVTHADDLEEDLRQFERLVRGAIGSFTAERRWFHRDGRPLWIYRKMALERDPAGRPQYCIEVIEDVTQRKQAEDELRTLNETLEQRVAERTELVRSLARKLTETEQRERRRLAKVLHDHLQQLLVAARLKASMFRRRTVDEESRPGLEQIEDLLNQAIEASRSLTVELCPPILYESGLAGGLKWLAGEMYENYGLNVAVEAEADDEPAAEELRIFLFEIVRELLFNVVKHAGVNEVYLHMDSGAENEVRILVADQGVGFQTEIIECGPVGTGCGLVSVRERLQWMQGRLEIDTAPGAGTRITVYAPRRLPPSPPVPLDLLSEMPQKNR